MRGVAGRRVALFGFWYMLRLSTFTGPGIGRGAGSGCGASTLMVCSASMLWFPGMLVSKSGRDPGILLLCVIGAVDSLSGSSSKVTLALRAFSSV